MYQPSSENRATTYPQLIPVFSSTNVCTRKLSRVLSSNRAHVLMEHDFFRSIVTSMAMRVLKRALTPCRGCNGVTLSRGLARSSEPSAIRRPSHGKWKYMDCVLEITKRLGSGNRRMPRIKCCPAAAAYEQPRIVRRQRDRIMEYLLRFLRL